MRVPPRSTPFPYTTLFRSAVVPVLWPPEHGLQTVSIVGVTDPDGDPVTITATGVTQDEPLDDLGDGNTCPDGALVRSEEHTSELQSLRHLVCRLLLEKKK